MTKKKVLIQYSEGWDECDDCGHYDWEAADVFLNGELKLSHSGDGHMGGGTWYEWKTAVTDILESLGYEVKLVDLERSSD